MGEIDACAFRTGVPAPSAIALRAKAIAVELIFTPSLIDFFLAMVVSPPVVVSRIPKIELRETGRGRPKMRNLLREKNERGAAQ
jgi:hypothetical protein